MQECKFCCRVARGVLLEKCIYVFLQTLAGGSSWYQIDPCTLAVPVEVEFERAALIRDQINALKSGDFRKSASKTAKSSTYKQSKRKDSSSARRR